MDEQEEKTPTGDRMGRVMKLKWELFGALLGLGKEQHLRELNLRKEVKNGTHLNPQGSVRKE